MLYQIRLNGHLPEAAIDYVNKIRDAITPIFKAMVVVNEGKDTEERGYFEIIESHHDETPTQPCPVLARWEVGRGKVL